MGVGKSTAIELMRELINDRDTVVLVKFAQPLYDIQEEIYHRIQPVYTRPESFIKDRTLLQWLGTDWGRKHISETLWVDLWLAKVNQHERVYNDLNGKDTLVIVCDDVRFDNEAETLRGRGGHVVKIVSNQNANRIQLINATHASEAGLAANLVDHTIVNDGTLEQYKDQLRQMLIATGVIENPDSTNAITSP